MQKILIDDNGRDEQGNNYQLWIYYYEPSDVGECTSPEILQSGKDKILLELQLGSDIAVPGCDLVRLKVSPTGESETIEKFHLAPDETYSLFKYWQDIDDQIRVEDRDENWTNQERILQLLKQNFPDRLEIETVSSNLNLTISQLTHAIACLTREHFIDIAQDEQTTIWLTPRGLRELTL